VTNPEPEDRQQEILRAVLKFLGIAAALCLFIGLATYFVVKSLNLNSTVSTGGNDSAVIVTPLPTIAITQPGAPTPSAQPSDPNTFDTPSPAVPTTSGASSALVLVASQTQVRPMARINLAGSWPGRDGVSLSVQRFEDGAWVDFGVQVQVRLGNFATYVETSRQGANAFRVYDPQTNTFSNQVSVTVTGN
jgi:hypothetical protein